MTRLAILLTVMLTACGSDPDLGTGRLAVSHDAGTGPVPFTLVADGNSMSDSPFGTSVNWWYQLQQDWPHVTVHVAAEGGYTVVDMLDRYYTSGPGSVSGDVVVVFLGTGGLNTGLIPRTIVDTLWEYCDLARSEAYQVIVIPPLPREQWGTIRVGDDPWPPQEELWAHLETEWRDHADKYLPLNWHRVLRDPTRDVVYPDGTHLSAAGNEHIKRHVKRAIEQLRGLQE